MVQKPERKGTGTGGPSRIKKPAASEIQTPPGDQRNNCLTKALLDSGCLIGDCMSQNIVDKLNAKNLIVYTKTTICSGFNNECFNNFPTLLINIS
jgi:hypothetical protein